MSPKRPHILLASSNALEMLENLRGVVDQDTYDALRLEIDLNVQQLFRLGQSHYDFAAGLAKKYWRQRASRFYYGAYNARRAINLHENGVYKTNVEDHKKTDLPTKFNNAETYKIRLRDLREDRNLADYDHTAEVKDLIFTTEEAEEIVRDFLEDAKMYLGKRGVSL